MADQDKVFSDIELCILPRQEDEYPLELRLEEGQVCYGSMPAEMELERLALPTEAAGDYLGDMLLGSPGLQEGWAKGRANPSRVRLTIHPEAAGLHELPWELLRWQGQWIAADPRAPFSRFLESTVEWGAPPAAWPVRVLAAISNPSDLDYLDLPTVDVAAERRAIERGLSSLGGAVEVAFLEREVSLRALEERLRRGFHILHFTGLGRYNRTRTQAVLLLQHEDGSALAAPEERIVEMLHSLPAPPALAVLSYCQNAAGAVDGALAGLAPRLVQAGLPAVIAMQGPLNPAASQCFYQALYQPLAEQGQVDLALNQARAALLAAALPGFELPLLFMRVANGQLWPVGASRPASAASAAAVKTLFAPLKRTAHILLEPGRSEIQRALAFLEEEAGKGDAADEKRVRRAFHYLADAEPEIWQSTVAALSAAAEGVSPLVQKVAKEEQARR